VVAGAEHPERVVYQQLSFENNNEKRGGVSTQCHVIYNVSPDWSWESYRVDHDPDETADLSDTDEACNATRSAVEKWFDLERVPAGAAEALLPARPAIATPLDVDYGEHVRLLGVDAPAKAAPGATVTITWTFEAKSAVPAGWKMFVHVEGPAKSFINGDHVPARPFEWWRAGQFIRYTTQITIPRTAARGAYTINAGMFKGQQRAPASSPHAKISNNAATVATFEVAP
jgi:hypothetical protein